MASMGQAVKAWGDESEWGKSSFCSVGAMRAVVADESVMVGISWPPRIALLFNLLLPRGGCSLFTAQQIHC